jgi:pyruvate formate lyase activating enzyme
MCIIAPEKFGICGVRKNEYDELVIPYQGILSSASLDPIEKKPLYHFFPGRTIYSIGFYGCNFRCPFCQNYSISQKLPDRRNIAVSPQEVVKDALGGTSVGIAYTYSEPVIHFEFVLETSMLAKKSGLKNVLISNGYLNSDPLTELLPYLDAVNIDLKSFSEDFYMEELGGRRDPVLDFIRRAAPKVHLEVTTLIIPGKNDSPEEIREISHFLAGIDKNIPLHLSCYFPRYKYSTRETTKNDLLPLIKIAKEYLAYVYAGNVRDETNTMCPNCGNLLVRRLGYDVNISGLLKNHCSRCGVVIPLINGDTKDGIPIDENRNSL